MGLGFNTKANLTVGKAGLFSRARTLTIEDVRSACAAYVKGNPLADMTSFGELWNREPGFSFSLHPAEEGIDFKFDGAEVFASAKTSSAGPGYHVFAIGLLEDIAKRLQLTWQWGAGDDEYQDETGYVHHRDFLRLQGQFAEFMGQLFRICLERLGDGSSRMQLAFPLHYGVKLPDDEYPGGALTQLGPFSREQLERGGNGTDQDRLELARRYFCWWEQGFGADFFSKLALTDMWMWQPWTAPATESERKEMNRVLGWIDQAKKMDAAIHLPELAVAELRKLARSTAEPALAQRGPIGYRRYPFTKPLTGHWTVTIPGCLRDLDSDDKGTVAYGVSNFEVYGSSFTITMKEGAAAIGDAEGDAVFDQKDLRGTFELKMSKDNTGYALTATANVPYDGDGQRGVLTIWYADESLRPLAEAVARSLRYDPPKPG